MRQETIVEVAYELLQILSLTLATFVVSALYDAIASDRFSKCSMKMAPDVGRQESRPYVHVGFASAQGAEATNERFNLLERNVELDKPVALKARMDLAIRAGARTVGAGRIVSVGIDE